MKNSITKARLLKKFSSYITFPKKPISPSEKTLKLKPFIKEISRIFVPETQSANPSPEHNQPQLPKPTLKKASTGSRIGEAKSDSTNASFHCYFSNDLSKSPLIQSIQKTSKSKVVLKVKTSERIPRMYRVRSSKVNDVKRLNDSFQECLKEYFTGISLPKPRKSQISKRLYELELVLQGSRNSVNAVETLEGAIWTAGSDCVIRTYKFPDSTNNPYSQYKYNNSLSCTEHTVVGKHKKSIQALARCSDLIVSGSSDGILKIWSSKKHLKKTLKLSPGLKAIKSLSDYKLITAGTNFHFYDLSKNSQFRSTIEEVPTRILSIHNEFTFLSGSNDCSLKLWDIRAPRHICSFTGHNDAVTGVSSFNDFSLLSCSDDCTMKEWDFRKQIAVRNVKYTEPLGKISVRGDHIITAGRRLLVWRKEKPEEMLFHDGNIKDMIVWSEKDLILAAGWDSRVSLWTFNADVQTAN